MLKRAAGRQMLMHINGPMPQTREGSKNNAWIAYMRKCAEAFRNEQAAKRKAQPGSKAPPASDQAKARAQLKEWTERKEERQRELSHAHMQRALEHAQKAEAGHKQKQARQRASK